jgi:HAD superfamily hydrolase (TIGR01509 family)
MLTNRLPVQAIAPLTAGDCASETQLAALLYDLDGTLTNTDPLHFQAWQEMLEAYGITIDAAFYQARISGRLNPVIVADLLPDLAPAVSQQFIEQKEARFRALAPQLLPIAGLHDLLNWATARHLRQGVVTNAPVENVHHTLQVLNLAAQFDQVVISDLLGVGKPDPAPYRHALDQFGLTPDRVLAFEDSPSGIRSAVAAGITTIGIASTHNPKALYDVGALLVIPDFAAPELWQLLEQRSLLHAN